MSNSAAVEPSTSSPLSIATWLIFTAAFVFAMVVIGGITRLTDSGLSMVEWRPIWGFLPPTTEAEWQRLFSIYQETPQFRYENFQMDLEGFKGIFFWEYVHRVFGRVIGLVYFLPFLFFLLLGRARGWLVAHLTLLLLLGGLQGFIGWWMVKSGLVNEPDVSHYRLTIHLGLAVFIYGYLLTIAFGLIRHRGYPMGWSKAPVSGFFAMLLVALIFVVILSGALVAGLDAGRIYNTFPFMMNHLVPPEIGSLTPMWRDLLENAVTVQFQHRALALSTLAALLIYWGIMNNRSSIARNTFNAIDRTASMAMIQVALGIATLVLEVPLWLGAVHQAGAMLVFTAALWMLQTVCHPTPMALPADGKGAIPAKPTPAKPTPAEPTPAEPTPAEPTPAEPTLAEPTLAEPTPAEPTLAEPTPAEPTPAEPTEKAPGGATPPVPGA